MLSILFHMHQPDYRHPRTGVPIMPWVRLHATRGYRDVPRLILETGALVTVNLVPTLLEQLDQVAAGGSDTHLELCKRAADTLSAAEAAWLVQHGLHGSHRAFEWLSGWGALRARRDRGERFGVADLRDLQVWCNLSWFGATALEDFPALGELRRQGSGYSESDKAVVLAAQLACARELRGLYAKLPDVSASPFAHPILPLLVDTAHAARNLGPFDDPGFCHPEDALAQLIEGKRAVEAWIGHEVAGVWPSEGSVSPEAVACIEKAGFSWFATDSGVLERSVRRGHGPIWRVGGMTGLFRDHGLSDRIGFVYADHEPGAAVDDLLHRTDGRRILLALDGENPWESYEDAGAAFLRTLFARAPLRTCTALAGEAPTGTVEHLHTGSWIHADFRIWIGAEEDRAAWRLLRRVRDLVASAGEAVPAAAWRALWRAEASDWFWWYGPEFQTPFAPEFDTLFRAHLAEVLRLIGAAPLPELDVPITASASAVSAPVGPVFPDREDVFAWQAAGRVRIQGGSMAPGPGWPSGVDYGWCGGELAFRLLGADGAEVVGWVAEVVDDSLILHGPAGERAPAEGAWRLLRPVARPT
ncbi:MAG: hypothetical protein EXR71_11710 [Myxococcales bacterium]|nr:hypothetical protein [Myxococcales bacterium]